MANIPTDPVTTAVVNSNTSSATATQTAATDSLKIKTTQILPTNAPDLKIGDVIQFLLKDVKANNVGILYYFGQLIEAKVPSGLKSGDVIRAEVQKQNDAIILKIKEILTTGNTNTSKNSANAFIFETDSNLTEVLTHKVEFLLKTLDAVLNKNSELSNQTSSPLIQFPNTDLNVSESIDSQLLVSLEKGLKLLEKLLPKDSSLLNSTKVKEFLQNIKSGPLLMDLTSNIENLSTTLDQSSISHDSKFLLELFKRLPPLKDLLLSPNSIEDRNLLNQELNKLLLVIGKEIENSNSALVNQTPTKINFRTSLQQIRNSLETLQTLDNLEEQNSALETLIKKTEIELKSNIPRHLIDKEDIINTSKKMLTNLESLVQSQEMLNRLEPILQALKEPQLLLFPFLLSGMLGFGKLAVDPDGSRDEKHKHKNANKNDVKTPLAYQGVIPLPNLGQVQFNAVQTDNEIELSFSLEDDEKKIFLESHLSDLRADLASAGITTTSISLNTTTFARPTLDGLEVEKPLVVL